MTGAVDKARTCIVVAFDSCETSTNPTSAWIRAIGCTPSSDNPPCSASGSEFVGRNDLIPEMRKGRELLAQH